MTDSDSSENLLRQSILERYAKLELSAAEAMDALGLGCYEDLQAATIDAGFHLPRIDRQTALALAKAFLECKKEG